MMSHHPNSQNCSLDSVSSTPSSDYTFWTDCQLSLIFVHVPLSFSFSWMCSLHFLPLTCFYDLQSVLNSAITQLFCYWVSSFQSPCLWCTVQCTYWECLLSQCKIWELISIYHWTLSMSDICLVSRLILKIHLDSTPSLFPKNPQISSLPSLSCQFSQL
jgi:hypothetical protein